MSTWSTSNVSWTKAVYTWGDSSVAYELSQVGGTHTRRDEIYSDLFSHKSSTVRCWIQ